MDDNHSESGENEGADPSYQDFVAEFLKEDSNNPNDSSDDNPSDDGSHGNRSDEDSSDGSYLAKYAFMDSDQRMWFWESTIWFLKHHKRILEWYFRDTSKEPLWANDGVSWAYDHALSVNQDFSKLPVWKGEGVDENATNISEPDFNFELEFYNPGIDTGAYPTDFEVPPEDSVAERLCKAIGNGMDILLIRSDKNKTKIQRPLQVSRGGYAEYCARIKLRMSKQVDPDGYYVFRYNDEVHEQELALARGASVVLLTGDSDKEELMKHEIPADRIAWFPSQDIAQAFYLMNRELLAGNIKGKLREFRTDMDDLNKVIQSYWDRCYIINSKSMHSSRAWQPPTKDTEWSLRVPKPQRAAYVYPAKSNGGTKADKAAPATTELATTKKQTEAAARKKAEAAKKKAARAEKAETLIDPDNIEPNDFGIAEDIEAWIDDRLDIWKDSGKPKADDWDAVRTEGTSTNKNWGQNMAIESAFRLFKEAGAPIDVENRSILQETEVTKLLREVIREIRQHYYTAKDSTSFGDTTLVRGVRNAAKKARSLRWEGRSPEKVAKHLPCHAKVLASMCAAFNGNINAITAAALAACNACYLMCVPGDSFQIMSGPSMTSAPCLTSAPSMHSADPTVTQLKAEVSQVQNQLKTKQEESMEMQTNLSELTKEIKRLRKETESNKDRMGKEAQTIKDNFSNLDNRLAKDAQTIKNKFSNLDKRLGKMDASVVSVQGSAEDATKAVARLIQKQQQQQKRQGSTQGTQSSPPSAQSSPKAPEQMGDRPAPSGTPPNISGSGPFSTPTGRRTGRVWPPQIRRPRNQSASASPSGLQRSPPVWAPQKSSDKNAKRSGSGDESPQGSARKKPRMSLGDQSFGKVMGHH
ncbi:hypothetical protein HYE67_009060 [Fusarium culmorum]|uniref:Uncharacterized protein n=1 Tax=Fusarium culmorum TaxID=5516 RepID=A0A7S8DE61_FUSCU|nr:hypothetical protein HYE67_009060 [Fusarium culmorum]